MKTSIDLIQYTCYIIYIETRKGKQKAMKTLTSANYKTLLKNHFGKQGLMEDIEYSERLIKSLESYKQIKPVAKKIIKTQARIDYAKKILKEQYGE